MTLMLPRIVPLWMQLARMVRVRLGAIRISGGIGILLLAVGIFGGISPAGTIKDVAVADINSGGIIRRE